MLSSRNPVESESEAIKVEEEEYYRNKAYTSALLASGFRQKDGGGDEFTPCPLGTFIDPSTKGEKGCQKCPPGNFYLLLIIELDV